MDPEKSIYMMDFYTNVLYGLKGNSMNDSLMDLSGVTGLPYIAIYRVFDPSIQGWTLSYLTHFRLSKLTNRLINTVPKDELEKLYTENDWLIHIDHKNNLWFNRRVKGKFMSLKYSLVKCSLNE